MSRKSRGNERVATNGGDNSSLNNPFAALNIVGLPKAEMAPAEPARNADLKQPRKGVRLDLRRETAGRHGKAVVTITPGDPMQEVELKELARELRQRLGSGGTLKDGVIEIQGDRLPEVKQFLEQSGYRCRQTGG